MNAMNSENGKPPDPMELACLPAGDPARNEFARKLADVSVAERDAWQQEWALSDRLRELLPQVEIPPAREESLRKRLMAVSQEDLAPSAGVSMWLRPHWRHAAAIAVIAGLIAVYFLWLKGPAAGGGSAARLDDSLGRSIATWAVRNHMNSPAMEVESSDPSAVQKMLSGNGFDFPVLMLKPSEGVELRGGGACDFGRARAAFTRWQGSGSTYTLYEFNGADVGAPSDFLTAVQTPKDLWHDDYQYRVIVWPGSEGKCCWALVIEKEGAKNVFSKYGYRS